MPDDAAFTPPHPHLGCPYAEVLIVTADLLGAPVEDDEVVHDLEEPLLAAELSQLPEQGIVVGGGVSFVVLPAQPVLLRRLDHAVAQPLGFVARHHERTVAKNGRMNSGFWLSRFWRMPSDTDTVERFSSNMPRAMPLT